MILLLMLAASTAPISAVVDQTADVALVAEYLDIVRVQKSNGDDSLADGVLLTNLDDKQNSTTVAFSSYANGCALAEISTIKNGLPLNVAWSCRHPEEDRHANFWLSNGKISRIQWGRRPVVEVVPLTRAKGGN